ncbi:hypothetical protein QBC37DRAFT_422686 [Rhypophila decipiens]|uniref:Methylated-DNA-[protein]-cysteine S-methyltransferase DNA binding domain-containing protein n=1 Tax=Rhypophila decipiens TaxID=261697 RepID=A0AAN6Y909_9PEZI|nr:hypothetical protein QBC37DRAFT_422686 [Rhypophila decipiens]
MARSDEAAAFFYAVYSAVQEIPPGKVTSYGHIAKLIGTPQRPRQVGICLKHLPSDTGARFNHDNVPWQRVINSKGIISPRSVPAATLNQATALQAEGVTVTTSAMGELMVDLREYGWFPRSLPSEADEGLEDSSSDESDDDDEDEVGEEDEQVDHEEGSDAGDSARLRRR